MNKLFLLPPLVISCTNIATDNKISDLEIENEDNIFAPNEPLSISPNGNYHVDYTPIDGSCGPVDIAVLEFTIENEVVSSNFTLTDGIVAQDNSQIDIWRAMPIGLHGCAFHVHTVVTVGDDSGTAELSAYCWEADYTCSE